MRVMLDNSICSHSQFAEPSMGPQGPRFGPQNAHYEVYGVVRKQIDANAEYQSQKDALFTIGRLIREKQIDAFTYGELMLESWNRAIGLREFDALANCVVRQCDSAIERSKLRGGLYPEYGRKGGKEDRKRGLDVSISQIEFIKFLCALDEPQIAQLISLSKTLEFTSFETDSLLKLPELRALCQIGCSQENYPDMFHLWTAQRNQMDVFLTLERQLPEFISKAPRALLDQCPLSIQVLRPVAFLDLLGISEPDPVPIEPRLFYPFFDIAGWPHSK